MGELLWRAGREPVPVPSPGGGEANDSPGGVGWFANFRIRRVAHAVHEQPLALALRCHRRPTSGEGSTAIGVSAILAPMPLLSSDARARLALLPVEDLAWVVFSLLIRKARQRLETVVGPGLVDELDGLTVGEIMRELDELHGGSVIAWFQPEQLGLPLKFIREMFDDVH
jgi:hypothetical protein